MVVTVKMVGTDYNKIVDEMLRLLEDKDYHYSLSKVINAYGDGKSSERINKILKKL